MGKVKDLYYDAKSCQSVPYDHNDYVKVIRCKDCKHYNVKYYYCKLLSEEPDAYSSGHTVTMDETDFCSYGESKSEK